MKIIETQSAVISNLEALDHVRRKHKQYQERQLKSYNNRGGGEYSNLYFALNEVKSHLESSPQVAEDLEGQLDYDDAEEITQELMPKLAEFGLTKPEKLMILNLKPFDADQLEAIVEESGERFTKGQMEEIAAAVCAAFRTRQKGMKTNGDAKGKGKAKVNGHG